MSNPEHEQFKKSSKAYRHDRANGRKVVRKNILFDAQGLEIEGYSVGRVADMLGVSNQTIVNWERWGWIPKPTVTNRKIRVYTEHQVNLIKEFHIGKERGLPPAEVAQSIVSRWAA